MLAHLQPGVPSRHTSPLLGNVSALLSSAVQAGEPLEQIMKSVVQSLGFDSFMYGMCTDDSRPDHDSRGYVWTTVPQEWVALYDRNAYVEIDPRLTETWNRTTPYIWDAASIIGGPQVRKFLSAAAQFDIRSGVVVSFRDVDHARIIVALNSRFSPVSSARTNMVVQRLGEIMLLATTFHDVFMAQFVDRGIPPKQQGAPLSPREKQCLLMAANGLTSAEIGFKLGVSERTANFHFTNIISKLDVLNRKEAIARAIAGGLIRLDR
jgi:DNA-binding CsgD family transcriptional regulator